MNHNGRYFQLENAGLGLRDLPARGVRHLLDADHKSSVALAGADREHGMAKGDAAGCARAFDFGARDVFETELVGNDAGEHLVGRTAWAIIAIGLHYGAFQVEALRAALDGVPVATLEAARALGLQGRELQRWIILPLALRQALPELGNTSVQIVKATAVAYAIAVPELLYAANRLWADNGNVAQMMPVLLLSYLLLVLAVTWLQRRLERHFRIPGEVGA